MKQKRSSGFNSGSDSSITHSSRASAGAAPRISAKHAATACGHAA